MGKEEPRVTYWTHTERIETHTGQKVIENIATCPACHNYPLYGEYICPYCGQALILPYDVPETSKESKDRVRWLI